MFTANEAVWIVLTFMTLRLAVPAAGLLLLGTWLQRHYPEYPYA